MKSHNNLPEELRAFCDQWHSDDGIEARERFRRQKVSIKRNEKRVRQLGKQVRRAIETALTGACSDPVLQNLEVISISPAPDASNLQVVVRQSTGKEQIAENAIQEKLNEIKGFLRSEVGEAITRKRVPELSFSVIPAGRKNDI